MGLPVQDPQQELKFDDNFKQRYSGDTFNYEGVDMVGHTPEGSGEYIDYKEQKEQNAKRKKNND